MSALQKTAENNCKMVPQVVSFENATALVRSKKLQFHGEWFMVDISNYLIPSWFLLTNVQPHHVLGAPPHPPPCED